MKVFIGATLAWVVISALLGGSLFLMTVKGIVWPFVIVFLAVLLLIRNYGCATH